MKKYVTRNFQFDAWLTIEYRSHKTIRNGNSRKHGRIIDCRIVNNIFIFVIIIQIVRKKDS